MAIAVSEKDASAASKRGDFAATAEIYRQLLKENPGSVSYHIEYADALAKDRQWDKAIAEYEQILKTHPGHVEALLGIATVRRWQGRTADSHRASEQARAANPNLSDPALSDAASEVQDHDYATAELSYQQALKKWPQEKSVQQAYSDFRHLRNPRVYGYYETDLSFRTRQLGASMAVGAREEFGVEMQSEDRIFPSQGNATLYTRNDRKFSYIHHFGFNHQLEIVARDSAYQYNVTVTDYTAIDTYQEYRLRYMHPLSDSQVLSVRYAPRPTVLKLSQDRFTAHKVEVELNSRWTPRVSTLLGTGMLRDLDSNATSAAQLTDRSLIKLGAQVDATNKLSLGARFITNPDLDNSMNSTLIAEGSYSVDDSWSTIARIRSDDYKTGAGQTALYGGARYVPNSQLWSEFGLKYVSRGPDSGLFGLVSVSYRF